MSAAEIFTMGLLAALVVVVEIALLSYAAILDRRDARERGPALSGPARAA